MRRFLRYLILIPVFIIVVVFAVANRSPVNLSFDPFSLNNPSLAIFEIPLFVVLFATLLVGIILGGICTWLNFNKKFKLHKNSQSKIDSKELEAEQL